MPGLPPTGELSYNGYTFDGATFIEVDATPLYDDAQVTVIAHRILIRVSAIVADGTFLDQDMASIRKRLVAAGAALTFTGKGYGHLDIGGLANGLIKPGTTKDIDGGPHPRILSWDAIADNKAAEIQWQVETTVPSCVNGIPRAEGVMALNYSVEYDHNEHGETVRTLTGYLQIAQSRGPAHHPDTADRYRHKFSPPPLKGFDRQQRWKVNEKKNRLEFTIVDTQIPSSNPYPAHMTAIEGSHRFHIGFRRENGFDNNGVISMTMSPKAGKSGVEAWAIFHRIVSNRFRKARNRGAVPWISDLDVEENIWGRAHSFSVRYDVLGCIENIIHQTGLFEPVGTDWNRWRISLMDSTFHQRGNMGLSDAAQDGAIVNLCTTQDVVRPNTSQNTLLTDQAPRPRVFTSEPPDSESSWRKYEMRVVPKRSTPSVRHSILQPPSADNGGWNPESSQEAPTGFTMESGTGGVTQDTIQVGGAPRHSVSFVGRAERVGYPVPRPKMESYGRQKVIEVGSRFMQWVTGGDVPRFMAAWVLDYIVPGSPGNVETPTNHQDPTGEERCG